MSTILGLFGIGGAQLVAWLAAGLAAAGLFVAKLRADRRAGRAEAMAREALGKAAVAEERRASSVARADAQAAAAGKSDEELDAVIAAMARAARAADHLGEPPAGSKP